MTKSEAKKDLFRSVITILNKDDDLFPEISESDLIIYEFYQEARTELVDELNRRIKFEDIK